MAHRTGSANEHSAQSQSQSQSGARDGAGGAGSEARDRAPGASPAEGPRDPPAPPDPRAGFAREVGDLDDPDAVQDDDALPGRAGGGLAGG